MIARPRWTQAVRVVAMALAAWPVSSVGAVAQGIDAVPCPVAWRPVPASTTQDLLGVAAAPDGSFAAVGRGGTIARSADGEAWEVAPSGVTVDLLAATWDGASFLATGATGIVLASPDGRRWQARESGSTAMLYGVACGAGRCVAVGAGGEHPFAGVILASKDGATWSDRTPPNTPPLLGVAWDGVRFVATGWVGAVATSPDALSWSIGSVSGEMHQCWFMLRPSYVYAAAGNGTLLVAVGFVVGDQYPGLGVSLASRDALTWECGQTELLPPYFRFQTVAWDGARFLAAGHRGQIGASADGLSWSAEPSPTTPTLLGLAVGPRRTVAVGEAGTILVRDCAPPRPPRRRLDGR